MKSHLTGRQAGVWPVPDLTNQCDHPRDVHATSSLIKKVAPHTIAVGFSLSHENVFDPRVSVFEPRVIINQTPAIPYPFRVVCVFAEITFTSCTCPLLCECDVRARACFGDSESGQVVCSSFYFIVVQFGHKSLNRGLVTTVHVNINIYAIKSIVGIDG